MTIGSADARTSIVVVQPRAEPARFDADDRIDPGIVVGRAIEDLHPDHRFFHRLSGQGALHDEAQEWRQAPGVRETRAGHYGFQFLQGLLRGQRRAYNYRKLYR